MAITITKQPQGYMPSNNPISFQFSSNTAGLYYFNTKLYEASSGSLLSSLNASPLPHTPKASFLNVSTMLSNVVTWELNTYNDIFCSPMTKTVKGYFLRLDEMKISGNTLVSGASYTGATKYVWNAKLDRVKSTQYFQSAYVISSANTISFLTTKPNYSKVNDISVEYLYFLQDFQSALYARVRTYDRNGTLLETQSTPVPDTAQYQMYRLNVSPKALKESFSMTLNDVHMIVVDVVDNLFQPKSEQRRYLYEDIDCSLEYMNVLWVNRLGGVDSYQFIAPQDSIQVDRFQIQRHTNLFDEDGVLSEADGMIYNPSDVIINSKTTGTVRLTSKHLSTQEAYWLEELYSSRQSFIELSNGYLVPTLLVNTSYEIQKLRYVKGQLNQMQIQLKLSDGIIPDGSHVYSSLNGNLEFIDSQMHAIEFNLDGYGVGIDPTNDYSDDDYSPAHYG